MPIPRQTLILGVALVVMLGAAYIYFFRTEPEPSLVTSSGPTPAEQRFLDLAAELSTISFNTGLFADPRFMSLVDLTTPILTETPGRPDPFLPLGR